MYRQDILNVRSSLFYLLIGSRFGDSNGEAVMAAESHVNVNIDRDAAHYLIMLLGDQLLDLAGNSVNQHVEIMRGAYEHIKTIIEQSLETT
jgi:hypothetical protein